MPDAAKDTASGKEAPGCNVVAVVKPWTVNGGSMFIDCTVSGSVPTLLMVTDWEALELPTL